jgi:hydroxymethylpyrimidine/phosphomethylpyrimidine kinase
MGGVSIVITMLKKILIIAGSDSGGGAGIQGDIKTITALGGYAATAITALTAQNTLGVSGIHEVPPSFISKQIRAVLSDFGADAIKTGMLHSSEVIHVVADSLGAYSMSTPLIVDPVMIAKGGAFLLQEEAITVLKKRLLPRATLLTPNIPEAERLVGFPINSADDMKKAGHSLVDLGAQAVLIKGGHLPGDALYDILVTEHTTHSFESKRIPTNHTHGTGCTLASAIALGIAQGMGLYEAVHLAHNYVYQAILSAPGIGKGHGPLNHLCNFP